MNNTDWQLEAEACLTHDIDEPVIQRLAAELQHEHETEKAA